MSTSRVRKRVLTSEESLQYRKRREAIGKEHQRFVKFLSSMGVEAVPKSNYIGTAVADHCDSGVLSCSYVTQTWDGGGFPHPPFTIVECGYECCECKEDCKIECATECDSVCATVCENVCVECPPECSGVCDPECSGVWTDLNFGDCSVMDIGPDIVGSGSIVIIESTGGGKLRFRIPYK